MNAGLLVGVLVAAYLQDVAFSCKTGLVAHGRVRLAILADSAGMLTNTLYMVLAAGSAVTTGLSPQTVVAFVGIMVGGMAGTASGMVLSAWLERRFGKPVPHRLRGVDQQTASRTD